MVHIDCCRNRVVHDEQRNGRSEEPLWLLCPSPDSVLQAREGQVLQGPQGPLLQVELWQWLWKQLWQ